MNVVIEVPLFPYTLFGLMVGTSICADLICFLCPSARVSQKGLKMKLRVRYENEYQTITLDDKATKEMWISLSLDGDESMTQEEKEELIQDIWNERFNRPDYNNYHKHNRHIGYSKATLNDEEETDTYEPLISEVRNPSIYMSDEINRRKQEDYDAMCTLIREKIKKKENADMVIAIALNGLTVGEYAEKIGDTPNNVSHRYRRAMKNLKKYF